MPLFPPPTPVTVLVDGRPLAAYERAYVARGRVFAPVSPLLTRVVDRLWFDGQHDGARARRAARSRALPPAAAARLENAYVMVGPVLRELGIAVRYEAAGQRLSVSTPGHGAVASPTPFNPAAPTVAPSAVFTPAEPSTPRPLWTGSPLPRRTPLPHPPPFV